MEYGDIISTFFTNVIFPILGAIILGLISLVLKKIANKFNLQEILAYQKNIEDLATSAIGYAEEIAAAKLKQLNNKETLTGSEKLDLAITWFMKQSPKIDEQQAKDWITSMLSKIEGVGATDQKIVPVTQPIPVIQAVECPTDTPTLIKVEEPQTK